MRFVIKGSTFLEGLKYISGSVASVDSRPTFRKFLVTKEADSDTIALFSSDGDHGVLATIPIEKGSGKGTAVLSFEDMLEFTKKFSGDVLTFSVEGNECEVSLSKSKHTAKVQSLDGSIFLSPPAGLDKISSKKPLSKESLIEALKFVFPARCQDASRAEIKGLDINGERVIASDGRVSLRHEVSSDVEALALTDDSSSELLRLLNVGSKEEPVHVGASGPWAFFKIGGCRFYTKVRPKTAMANLDRTLEKCQKANKETLIVSKSALEEGLAVVRLATFPEDRRASFKLLKTKIVIQAQNRDGGVGTAEIAAEWSGRSGFETILNLDYLETILKDFSGEKAGDKTDLITFRPSENEQAPILLVEGPKIAAIQPSTLGLARTVKASVETKPKEEQKVVS